jgi:hypothetical protein
MDAVGSSKGEQCQDQVPSQSGPRAYAYSPPHEGTTPSIQGHHRSTSKLPQHSYYPPPTDYGDMAPPPPFGFDHFTGHLHPKYTPVADRRNTSERASRPASDLLPAWNHSERSTATPRNSARNPLVSRNSDSSHLYQGGASFSQPDTAAM